MSNPPINRDDTARLAELLGTALLVATKGEPLPFTLIIWTPTGMQHFSTRSIPRLALAEGMEAMAHQIKAAHVAEKSLAAAAPETRQ